MKMLFFCLIAIRRGYTGGVKILEAIGMSDDVD